MDKISLSAKFVTTLTLSSLVTKLLLSILVLFDFSNALVNRNPCYNAQRNSFFQIKVKSQDGSDDNYMKEKLVGKDYSKQMSNRKQWTVEGPPLETKPDYNNIHGPMGKWPDNLFQTIFRKKLAEKAGFDSSLPEEDYQGIIEVTAAINARYSDREQVQSISQDVMRSLFPSWLPGRFAIMFAKPFPQFSSRMNAWATRMVGTWLMGECEINDCEIDSNDGNKIGINQGVLVKRCRFLEETKCASICVNSCKIPTQNFFIEDMGLPLTMTPDYETGECQFSFGLTPTATSEFDAKNTPCLSQCPSMGKMRDWHSSRGQCNSMES